MESIREKGKVRQRTLFNLGSISEANRQQLINIAQKLLYYCGVTTNSSEEFPPIKELGRRNWGAPVVIAAIWKMLDGDNLIEAIQSTSRIKFDLKAILLMLLADRICSPKSKLGSFHNASHFYQIPPLELHHLYRAMDVLADKKELIEKHLFESQKKIYKTEISAVFYDVTTFYFESKKSDDLRNFGFSKDCKFNDVQVVLGFILDESGAVLGYDLFEGNTFEGKTLSSVIVKLKSKFNIKKVFLVADRGLNSADNLAAIREAELEYIVGSRLKNFSSESRKWILSQDNFTTIVTDQANDQPIFKYKKMPHTRTHQNPDTKEKKSFTEYVSVMWSEKRAWKDKADREKMVEKAKTMINNPSLLKAKNGAKKFIKKTSKSEKFQLDINKIEKDQLWDGFYGIACSNPNLSTEQVCAHYHSLWRIEALIRSSKSFLETRPVFHWTSKRIKGHFNLCFISLVLQRALEKHLAENGVSLSENAIRNAVCRMEFSEIEVNDRTGYLVSELDQESQKILQALEIKLPPNLSSKEGFNKTYKVL